VAQVDDPEGRQKPGQRADVAQGGLPVRVRGQAEDQMVGGGRDDRLGLDLAGGVGQGARGFEHADAWVAAVVVGVEEDRFDAGGTFGQQAFRFPGLKRQGQLQHVAGVVDGLGKEIDGLDQFPFGRIPRIRAAPPASSRPRPGSREWSTSAPGRQAAEP
jgi:hypothetical protein